MVGKTLKTEKRKRSSGLAFDDNLSFVMLSLREFNNNVLFFIEMAFRLIKIYKATKLVNLCSYVLGFLRVNQSNSI